MKQPKMLIRKILNNNASRLVYRKLWKREDCYLCKCHGRAGWRRINSVEMGHESVILSFLFE